jgi:hypothetical protein
MIAALRLLVLILILSLSYLLKKIDRVPKYINILIKLCIGSYLLYNNKSFVVIIFIIKYIYKRHKKLFYVTIVFIIYYYSFSFVELLADEKERIHHIEDITARLVLLCIACVVYMSEINLSNEDRTLYSSLLEKNKKNLLQILENIDTVAEIQNYGKSIIDNTLEHKKAREVTDTWVFFILQHIFILYNVYIQSISASCKDLILPSSFTATLAWVLSIIRGLFGL